MQGHFDRTIIHHPENIELTDATFHYRITGMPVTFHCLRQSLVMVVDKLPVTVSATYNENHINVGYLLVKSGDMLVIAGEYFSCRWCQ